ncbi:hypothetical protein NEHOM01_0116 [Nematocida homosporus]|uniref:uncharacterized protein n=1 Tax=Nematocida homosporus TaxID=1912981 RepID=UPI00221F7B0B|nr:uncharacterized protein NEHOM01_0116 [Nematocida homosporus]KAI5184371.1 hypothetical protein NEHOM01_0116 [Nematocida homosporus]
MINQRKVWIRSVKVWVRSVDVWGLNWMKGWAVGLCVLLMGLSCVRAGGRDVGVEVNGISVPPLELPGLADMTADLTWIGFAWDTDSEPMEINPYTPPAQSLEPISELNPTLNPINRMLELVFSTHVHFALPEYSDVEAATAALELLRKIAVIRLFWGKCAYVTYTTSNLDCHQINMEILSRVVNLFDCTTLELCLKPHFVSHIRELDLGACQNEAQKTVDQATYNLLCRLKFSTELNNGLLALINSNVVLLRPISGVFLVDNEIDDAPLLSRLPLKDGYMLYFMSLPSFVVIDLRTLQSSQSTCSQITIEGFDGTDLTIVGLENAADEHPGIVLEAEWHSLMHLCSSDNISRIRVHTLVGIDVEPANISAMLSAGQRETPQELRIRAIDAITIILPCVSCQTLEYYKHIYTREAYEKFGIWVSEVNIRYASERTDLYDTLDTLVKIGALSEVPTSILEADIVCCGHALNDSDWEVHETVRIQVNYPDLHVHFKNYQSQHYVCFCQNIRYTTIELNGAETPCKEQVEKCAHILTQFWCIRAKTLKLINIRNGNQIIASFSPETLNTADAQAPKWGLYADTLVFDNVDDQIVYWVLGRYFFGKHIKIVFMSQHFTNMAIAQYLSHPCSHMVSSLVITDLTELDEVKYFNQQDKIKTFSLFKYIEEELAKGTPIESLGLHKLLVRLNNIDVSLYNDVLRAFWGYGIMPLAIPLDAYIALSSTNPKISPMCKDEFTLYGATLKSIKADLSNCRARRQTQSIPDQSQQSQLLPFQKQSVKALILRFNEIHSLVEADFVTIIRWISCRFKDIASIWLENVEMLPEVRAAITARDYLFSSLTSLTSIRMESAVPGEASIELLVRSHHLSLVASTSNPVDAVIAMQSTLLSQLACHLTELNNYISNRPTTEITIRRIINYITHQPPPLECVVCLQPFIKPQDEDKKQDDDEPPAKKPCFVANPEMLALSSHLTVNSEIYLSRACWFACGHPLCNGCAIANKALPDNRCPSCRQSVIYESIRQLVSAPQSIVVFATDSLGNTNVDCEWPTSMTYWDDQVLLYVTYRDGANFDISANTEIAYNNTHSIHII